MPERGADLLTHRAGVAGKPVGHSRSPAIHTAGYAAAGLVGWSYTAIECAQAELPDLVAALGPEWVGLSLTMPLKEAALAVAAEVSPLAATLGAANTLVRRAGRWFADNTDAGGLVDALGGAGVTAAGSMTILGSGGTARAALAAARDLGVREVSVVARRGVDALRPAAGALGLRLSHVDWNVGAAAGAWARADVVVSTVPAGVADQLTVAWGQSTVLLDALYHPWPTPLASSAAAAGCRVVPGAELLLAQAARQFVLFTGVDAPVPAMRAALAS